MNNREKFKEAVVKIFDNAKFTSDVAKQTKYGGLRRDPSSVQLSESPQQDFIRNPQTMLQDRQNTWGYAVFSAQCSPVKAHNRICAEMCVFFEGKCWQMVVESSNRFFQINKCLDFHIGMGIGTLNLFIFSNDGWRDG